MRASCVDSAGASVTHPVGERDQRRPVRDEHDGPPVARRRIASMTSRSVLAVEVRRRLVEQQQRRVAQERARERDALALAGGEPGAALAETVSRPSGSLLTVSVRPASAIAAQTSSVEASLRPSRTFSAIVALNRWGRWGTHASRARHASRSSSARSTSADADRAALRGDEPEQHAEQRRLAAPARPDQREQLARRDRQRDSVERRLERPW